MSLFLALTKPAIAPPPPPPPPASDTTAPTIPIGMSVATNTPSSVTIQGLTPSDPSPPGSGSWSGLGSTALNILRTPPGSVIGTVAKSSLSGADNQPALVLTDIGAPSPASILVQTGADITLTTVGDNIYGTADQFAYAAQAISGTVQAVITFTLAAWAATTAWAKAEAQFRASLAPGSAFVSALAFPYTPGQGWIMESRASLGAAATQGALAPASAVSKIILVQSVGGTYHAYYSLDGNTLISLGSVTQAMGSSIFAGVALTSGTGAPGTSVSATFSQVSIQTLSNWTYTDGTVAANTSYAYQAQASDAASTPNLSALGPALTVTTPAGVGGGGGPVAIPFPRLGGYPIGGNPRSYDSLQFRTWAKTLGVVIPGIWDGWQNGDASTRTMSFADTCADIDTGSVAIGGTAIIPYTDCLSVQTNEFVSAVESIISSNKFWLLTSYPGGSTIPASYAGGLPTQVYNPAVGGPTFGGRTGPQYLIDYYMDWYVKGGSLGLAQVTTGLFGPNSHTKGLYLDDFQMSTQVAGDWARSGSSPAAGDASASQLMRSGFAAIAARWQAANPGAYFFGNLSGIKDGTGITTTGLSGLVHGGEMEGMIGLSWSPETSSWAFMMANYKAQIGFCITPKLAIFSHSNVRSDGSDFYTQGVPWQAYKYGLCSALQDDGYYFAAGIGTNAYTNANDAYSTTLLNFFDYYAIDPTNGHALAYPGSHVPGMGYLGNPLDVSWTAGNNTPWQLGVYRRRFQNPTTGMIFWVLVNPKGNGSRTLTLGTTMNHITGIQDTSVDNGGSVTTVTMPDRSGMILHS